MKYLIFCAIIFFSACNGKTVKLTNIPLPSPKDTLICGGDTDSLMLVYAANFTPHNLDLSKTMPQDLDSFLLHTDTLCLQRQSHYQIFVTTILVKLFYYHLVLGHQSYDLQFMEQGGAKVIIEGFKQIAGYRGQSLEWLSSGAVMNYIDQNKRLRDNALVDSFAKKVEDEAKLLKRQFSHRDTK
jgi:hypothetical protein